MRLTWKMTSFENTRVRWTKDTRGRKSGRRGGETGARRGDSILGTRSWREVTTSRRNSHPCTEFHLHEEIWPRERSRRCIAIPRVDREEYTSPCRFKTIQEKHVTFPRGCGESRHRAEFRAHILQTRADANPRNACIWQARLNREDWKLIT